MAKTEAPLLSFSGSGQIAKTQVYASWRGVPYVRRYVVPANPNTTAQQETRSVFKWATQVWKLAGPLLQAPWTAFAQGQPLTNRNAYVSSVVKNLRGATDLTDYVGSPGAKGGLPPATFTASASGTTVTGALTAPTLPTGWSITDAVMTLLANNDPGTATSYTSYEGDDTSSPYAPTISDVPSGTYEASGWFVFAKPDGSVAYGPSINTTVVVS